jgi:uncharacterized surface protein with fasciclin (FAS1) repeats
MVRTLKNTILILSLIVFTTCIGDDYDKNYTTFEEDTVTSFFKKNPEMYSEFSRIMEATGMADLMNAYGAYTCFAPTNEAFRNYYAEKNTSFEQLSQDDMREITYTHILKKKIRSKDFPDGVIPEANMYEQYLSINYSVGETSSIVYVNESARILVMDQDVHNGVIHTIDLVLQASKTQLPEIIAADGRYSLFYQALRLTKMEDSLRLVKDYFYVEQIVHTRLNTGDLGTTWPTPPFRKHGYTAFVESDSLFNANNIYTIDDLKRYAAEVYDIMYPTDINITELTDRRNSLNRFISYHLMDRMQAENEFFPPMMVKHFISGLEIHEYIEMMCPNTLLEISKAPNEALINKRRNGDAIRIIFPNHAAENGLFHEIDKILIYDEAVENDVLNKKLRIDAASIIPELATNKIRQVEYCMYLLPQGYAKNLSFSEGTEVFYKMNPGWGNIGGDEIILGGKYDFTLKIPPIPAGTYEIRFRHAANVNRSIAQFYLDGVICRIPLDLKILASDPRIGYLSDSDTDDDGLENDKMMHNRGYMKDINTAFIQNFMVIARNNGECVRTVLLTKTFTKTEPHFLRIKSVEEKVAEFQLDYLEFVPTHVLPTEGKD